MNKQLDPPLGSYEGDPLMPDPRIAELEAEVKELREAARNALDELDGYSLIDVPNVEALSALLQDEKG